MLIVSKKILLPRNLDFILVCVLCILIWNIGAVINDNRPVSKSEYQKFLKKLHISLISQIVLVVILIEMNKVTLINILICSLMINFLSLVIGRVKYQNSN